MQKHIRARILQGPFRLMGFLGGGGFGGSCLFHNADHLVSPPSVLILSEWHGLLEVGSSFKGLYLPLVSREWRNGSNSSYNCTPFLHSLLTKGKYIVWVLGFRISALLGLVFGLQFAVVFEGSRDPSGPKRPAHCNPDQG